MKPRRRRNTVTIIPERKHARPAGIRLITRSTTVRPFVYSLPDSEQAEEPASIDSKRSKENNTSGSNNTTILSSDQNLANKTHIPTSSFYHSTPNSSLSPRKRRYINRSLLKSFNSSQDASDKDARNEDHHKPRNDLLQDELIVSEKLRSPPKTPPLQKTPQKTSSSTPKMPPLQKILQKTSSLSKPKFSGDPPQEKLIINRKHSFAKSTETLHKGSQKRHSPRILSKLSPDASPPEVEKIIKRRKSERFVNITVSQEVLQEAYTEVNTTSAGSKIQSVDSSVMQSPSHLIRVPSVVIQRTSLTSATTLEGTNIENEKFDLNLKGKNDSKQEKPSNITRDHSIFITESSVTLQRTPCPISKTSTPIKLKSTHENNKNLIQISEIIPDDVSTVAVEENHSLANAHSINKAQRIMENNANMQETFFESHRGLKLKNCSVVLDNFACLIRVMAKVTSLQEKQSENNEHLAVEDEDMEGKMEQEKDVADGKCLTNADNNNEQDEMILGSATPTELVASFSHPPLESSILQLKNQSDHVGKYNTLTKLPDTTATPPQSINVNKNTEQEELLLVSSVACLEPPVTSAPIENSTSSVNGALTKQISSPLPQLQSVQHNKSPTADKATSKLNLQPQNKASDNHDAEPVMFEHAEPFASQKKLRQPSYKQLTYNASQNKASDNHDAEPVRFEHAEPFASQKKLRQPSYKQLTYNAVVGKIRRTVPRQPTKRKRKTKPDYSVNHSPGKRPLFAEHKKIMLWTGETGKRRISDLSDLDVALNVIDQVVEEISEEDQTKQNLLHKIREKYHHSVHKMIRNVGVIKRVKKEVKELMVTVKELVDELDHVVDKKVRLHSEFLDSETQIKTSSVTVSGPTWEEFSNF